MAHLSLIALFLASFVCFTATPLKADACRLNTTIAAQGNGHNAACLVAQDGKLEVVEYGVYDPIDANHDGSDALLRDIRGAPTHVALDPQGNLTFESMERIVNAFADYYGIDIVNVSHFPEADNTQNALAELDKMKAEISAGQKYNMFRRNCDDIASKLILAAGANAVATGLIPNVVSNEERRGEAGSRIAAGDWSGKWQRDAAGHWNFRAGQ